MMSVRHRSSQDMGLQLPPALQLYILSLLPPNDRALSGRLVSPDAAADLSGPQHCTARLYKPLPTHAIPWAVEAGQQHVRQLPFRHKLQLLCTAAETGSEANLEVALVLLQPSVFPQLLYQDVQKGIEYPNPGVAAVEEGHPQLLGWLLRHCPARLADRRAILMAAAKHCDLAGLQAAWVALDCSNSTSSTSFFDQTFLDGFAASHVNGKAKMEWVLAEGRGSCSLQESTAAAAARSRDLGRYCLRALCDTARAWSAQGMCWTLQHGTATWRGRKLHMRLCGSRALEKGAPTAGVDSTKGPLFVKALGRQLLGPHPGRRGQDGVASDGGRQRAVQPAGQRDHRSGCALGGSQPAALDARAVLPRGRKGGHLVCPAAR